MIILRFNTEEQIALLIYVIMMYHKNNTSVPQCRDNHLTDDITSRDLMGNSRGRCLGCSSCGKYIIYTKEKYYGNVGDQSVCG